MKDKNSNNLYVGDWAIYSGDITFFGRVTVVKNEMVQVTTYYDNASYISTSCKNFEKLTNDEAMIYILEG